MKGLLIRVRNMFRRITPLEMATAELVDAELAKMEADTGKEFAEAMCTYHAARITRLKKHINVLTKEEKP